MKNKITVSTLSGIVDPERRQLVDDLLDKLQALKRSTTPQEDLRVMAASLLDHADDLARDEAGGNDDNG